MEHKKITLEGIEYYLVPVRREIKKGARSCKGCGKDISKKHINAKFCRSRGRGNCKDRYHNLADPSRRERGYPRTYLEDGESWIGPDGAGEDQFGDPIFVGVSDFDNTSCQNSEPGG